MQRNLGSNIVDLHRIISVYEEGQKNAQIGSWDWNLVTGEIYWTPEMYRILRLNSKNDTPTYDLALEKVHPADRDYYEMSIKRALEDKSEYDILNRIQLKSGIRYMHSMGTVFKDENGKPVRMFGTVQDITDIKIHEQKLIEKNEELESFRKMVVGRELKMIELKKKINRLKESIGHSENTHGK